MKSALKGLICAVACMSAAGCSINASVADFSQNKIEVRRIKLKPMRRSIKIIHGGSERIIRLSNVESIAIYPDVMKNAGGGLYYQTEIVLDDGTKIGFSDPSKNKPADAYISIDGALRGRTEGGKYTISMAKVSLIEILD